MIIHNVFIESVRKIVLYCQPTIIKLIINYEFSYYILVM